MARKSARGLGPYPIVLAGLFVLSFLAVHTWRGERTSDTFRMAGSETSDVVMALPTTEARVEPADGHQPRDEEVAPDDMAVAPDPRPIDLSLLEALATPRIRSQVAPPVADRIITAGDLPEPPALPPSQDIAQEAARVANRIRRRPEPSRHGLLPLLPRQNSSIDYLEPVAWPHCESLVSQFAELVEVDVAAGWARRVVMLLDELENASSIGSPEAARILDQLERAVTETPLVNTDRSQPIVAQISRVQYALIRRLTIWRQVQRIVKEEPAWRVSYAPGDVASSLRSVDVLLQPVSVARGWREYLLIDQLKMMGATPDVDNLARRVLAQRVLERLNSSGLTSEQRHFLDQPTFTQFSDQLRRWAYEPLDYADLLVKLEALENSDSLGGDEVSECWRVLRWSPWSQTSDLAQSFDVHYRNANVRVAISGDFINRMLPSVQTFEENVDDQILGTAVNGRSTTMARLFVELVPDKMRWRLGLVARGNIDSQTWSEKGPITLFTNGATRYHARKLLTIDRGGVLFHRAEAEAANDAELTNVATDFDGVPLVGSLMRSLARRGHAERIGEANAEVESKVGYRVAQRLDDEVAAKIQQAGENYQEKLLRPLRELRLNPVPTDMQTTDRRLIVRYRLAADHQLAAHTPRPNAPGDSLLSVQVHESAINNTIEQLGLEGRQISLVDLYRELSGKFGKEVEPPAEIPDDIMFAFAEEDAVRVRFHDGRVELTLRFRAMQAGRNLWENFEVHTKLATEVSDRMVRLVRNDVIELRGQLGFQDRLPMRAIFTAMLARDRVIPILDPHIANHPKLDDVVVSQCVVLDGWIGVALSPRARVATRPEPVRTIYSERRIRR